jgi:hypothetical protein
MQAEIGFRCQWELSPFSFLLEADLFTHTKTIRQISCVWKGYNSTNEYTNRGHLADHVITHLSKSFMSVWCKSCRAGYRNRQSLHRHQKKSGCNGSSVKGGASGPFVPGSSLYLEVGESKQVPESIRKACCEQSHRLIRIA